MGLLVQTHWLGLAPFQAAILLGRKLETAPSLPKRIPPWLEGAFLGEKEIE
jgi:hypothetical protein